MNFLNAWIQIFFVGLAAHSLGKFLISRWIRFNHAFLSVSAYASLGMLVFSYVLFGLVYTFQLSAEALWIFYGLLGLIALPSLKELFDVIPEWFSRGSKKDWIPAFAGMTIFCYFLWIWLVAALPATSVDEVIYHLAIPKAWMRHGGGVLLPNSPYAFFPQLGEMFFLLGWGTVGEMTARFYHSLWGVLLALALYGFSRQWLSQFYSFFAAAFFMTIPSVMVIQSWAYVDLTYTLYALLALVGILQFHQEQKMAWMVFAGVMVGGALCVKYTGLQYLVLLIVFILILHIFQKKGTETQKLLVSVPFFVLTALFIGAPYLIRNWIQTGWPLFPFQVLGLKLNEGMNWDPERARLFHGWLSHFGTPLGHETIWHTLLAPVLVFVRARFDSIEFYDGVLGPLFLLIPFLLISSKKGTGLDHKPDPSPLMLFSLIFLFYWTFTTKQVRFLLPIMPIFCLLLAWGLSKWKSPWLTGLAGILMFWNLFTGVNEVWKKNPLPFWQGKESPDLYIARQLGNYPFYRLVRNTLKPEDKLFQINMKNYGYFLNDDYESDFIFERWRLDALLKQQPTENQIAQFFKDLRVTHLMMDEGYVTSADWGMEPELLNRFKDFMKEKAEGVLREGPYALYRLKE